MTGTPCPATDPAGCTSYVDFTDGGMPSIVFDPPPPNPRCIRVKVDQEVRFTNLQMNTHYPAQTCGPEDGAFTLNFNGTASASTAVPGEYRYECGVHGASYAGTIIVEP